MKTRIRIETTGVGGVCQECGLTDHDGPLACVTTRVPGPAGYVTYTYVGECCQGRLVRQYREQADRGEIEYIDARVTGPDLPRYH
jgi:hypothetical protein